MAATFTWEKWNGNSSSPTTATPITDCNWKNADDNSTAYSSAPVSAGNNSYELWIYGKYTGTFNQVLNGKWSHSAGTLGTGLTLKGAPAGSSPLTYTTPATTANANLSVDMTAVTAVSSGTAVYFSGTTPNGTTAKTATTTANPAYTNFLATQMQTTSSAAAGDSAVVTLSLQYDEN